MVAFKPFQGRPAPLPPLLPLVRHPPTRPLGAPSGTGAEATTSGVEGGCASADAVAGARGSNPKPRPRDSCGSGAAGAAVGNADTLNPVSKPGRLATSPLGRVSSSGNKGMGAVILVNEVAANSPSNWRMRAKCCCSDMCRRATSTACCEERGQGRGRGEVKAKVSQRVPSAARAASHLRHGRFQLPHLRLQTGDQRIRCCRCGCCCWWRCGVCGGWCGYR